MKTLLESAISLYLKQFKNPTVEFLDKINYCRDVLIKNTKIAVIEKEFALYFNENGAYIKEGDVLSGKDISNHLKGCSKAIFFIVTLGVELDRQINLLQYKDLSISYILDELASILVDIKSDKIEENIRKNKTISTRYSCGYGDYDISNQTNICRLLNSEKIGVRLTSGGMLYPTKTISAVIGVKE